MKTARDRLRSILREGWLWGFEPFAGESDPAICLTEATSKGLGYLVKNRAYHPWGLVFDRQSVYDVGGGPVWHVRQEEWDYLRSRVDARLRARMVRLSPGTGPGTSDWLWEREWRIPLPASKPFLSLYQLSPRALLVDGLFWTKPNAAKDALEYEPGVPDIARGVPHWIWNGETFVEGLFPR